MKSSRIVSGSVSKSGNVSLWMPVILYIIAAKLASVMLIACNRSVIPLNSKLNFVPFVLAILCSWIDQIKSYMVYISYPEVRFSHDKSYMSHIMRKPFCIWENKGANQLHGNRAADWRYFDNTITLLPKS